MTGPFEFATARRVVVGPGRVSELPVIVAALGSRVLICTGSRPDRHAEVVAGLSLPTAAVAITAEPTVQDARAAAEVARAHEADVVVGIGGGSVLDLAKAVAMLLGNGGDPLDYLELVGRGQPISRESVPFVAIPTTAGTGAEVTANAVLTVPEHQLKASLRSPLMIPRVALVDPLLTLDCPPGVTASSGLDAVTQCLEPFVSRKANPMTDGLAREGLRRAGSGLRRAYLDGTDLDARQAMSVCSLLGGMALANAKLGAVHGLAGVVGGTVTIPHGVACAALLAAVIETNVRALESREPASPVLARYEEAARLLTGGPDASIADGIGWIRRTTELLGISHLGAFGLRPDQVDGVVTTAAKASSMQGNPIRLTDDELRGILTEALG